MIGRDIADEVLVISLPERIDRRRRVAAILDREGIPFDFVDGGRVKVEDISQKEVSELYPTPFKVVAGWNEYLRAAIGCKRAHINCLERGLEKGKQRLLVMEDDVDLRADWHPILLRALSDLPAGWLQLYLSADSFRTPSPFSPNLKRLNGARQTTAILYSREGMRASLNCILTARAELDWWMGLHLHPFGCSYVVEPQITFQTGGFSDCRGTYRGSRRRANALKSE